MSKERITKREREQDAAEKWLSENDPEYVQQKKKWQTPSTDVLARDRMIHQSMKELTALKSGARDGNYRKYPKTGNGYVSHKFENQTAIESENDKADKKE